MISKFSPLFFFFVLVFNTLIGEENFILINGVTGETVYEMGPHVNERVTPCSTFKIALSLMGFNDQILQDEKTPLWPFREGYDEFLESWKTSQNPQSWMKNSCVWYSKVLSGKLGLKKFNHYLSAFEYGNQDSSGGLTEAWLSSSLKISAKEQVEFIQKIVKATLPISKYSHEMTKVILFMERLPNDWKLFGKTGWSGSTPMTFENGEKMEIGWFIGWIEKDNEFFPFAYNIREDKIKLANRIPRVKQLLLDSIVTSSL